MKSEKAGGRSGVLPEMVKVACLPKDWAMQSWCPYILEKGDVIISVGLLYNILFKLSWPSEEQHLQLWLFHYNRAKRFNHF